MAIRLRRAGLRWTEFTGNGAMIQDLRERLAESATMERALSTVLALLVGAGIFITGAHRLPDPARAVADFAIDSASQNPVASRLSGRDGRHLGFDTYSYPGDAAMSAMAGQGSPYEWVGYYLPSAPCHKGATWAGKRERIKAMGLGIAVIYVGQQTWGKMPGERHMIAYTVPVRRKATIVKGKRRRVVWQTVNEVRWREAPPMRADERCHTDLVSAQKGWEDGADAINRTMAEGFTPGSTIFLDVEHMDNTPDRMRQYYRAWTERILRDGRYRVGIYVHTHNAELVYSDAKDVYNKLGIAGEPQFWVVGKPSKFDFERAPTDVGHQFASMWQGWIDRMITQGGIMIPGDINVASTPDPSGSTVGSRPRFNAVGPATAP